MYARMLPMMLSVFALWAQEPARNIQFDIRHLDRTVDPCVDFYQYACGSWMKNNPIPADQSRWGRFSELAERNRLILREILEKAARPDPGRTPVERQIGDYYAACMDVAAIDRKGLDPLRPELGRIAALKDSSELAGQIIHMHRHGVGALFGFGSGQDFKDSTAVIAQLDQGGLGLPDRDYYLKTDARSVELRRKYQQHVERMFTLAGYTAGKAQEAARTVMDLETALAKGSLDLVSRRDPEKIYHKMTLDELAALAPRFNWRRYIASSGAPEFQAVNVAVPEFFRTVNTLLETTPLDHWKTYLTWHLLHAEVPMLPTRFVEENFDFYGRTLNGAKELRPRWKRCVDYTDNQLGEALGRQYVEKTLGAEGKQRVLRMVADIEKALGQDFDTLTWMTPQTRQRAFEKLRAITNKIGYPEKWRDYSAVKISRDDPIGNGFRADQFEFQRQLNKIGKPVDRDEWFMTPPTVNAYYDPQMNNINFPAGILQPPFYDGKMDDAVNLGAIGAVIGHELTHGFDDQGRQFDARGNMNDWWTEKDAKEFERRAACFVDQYSKFEAAPGVKLNGKLTLGENVADNGGLRIAYMALENRLASQPAKKVDGFTPQQRLFLGFAQVWCQNSTEESRRLLAAVDPHSPPNFRVNGTVQNMPEFQRAFSCKAGQPMVSANACRVW